MGSRTCSRCKGTGRIGQFSYRNKGKCYRCKGSGQVSVRKRSRRAPLPLWLRVVAALLFSAVVTYNAHAVLLSAAFFTLACAVLFVYLPKPRKREALKQSVRQAVFQRDGYRCRHCKNPNDLTIDHVKPVSHGGSDKLKNLVTLCDRCNKAKSNQRSVVGEAWVRLGIRRRTRLATKVRG